MLRYPFFSTRIRCAPTVSQLFSKCCFFPSSSQSRKFTSSSFSSYSFNLSILRCSRLSTSRPLRIQNSIRFLSTATSTTETSFSTTAEIPNSLSLSSSPSLLPSIDSISTATDAISSAVTPIVDSPSPLYNSGVFTHTIHVALDYIHSTIGLPWWASIIALTVGLRTALLVLAVPQQRNVANLKLAQPYLKVIQDELAAQKQSDQGVTQAYAIEHRKKILAIFQAYNCNPMKSMIMPLLLIPVFLTFFYAIPTMQLYRPSFHYGGFPPVMDLALPDPTMLLPIINFIFMIIPMELGAIQAESGGVMTHNNAILMRNVFRIIAIVSIFVTKTFPAGLLIYWMTSNVWTTLQYLAFRNDTIRKLLKIPIIETDKTFKFSLREDLAWILEKFGIKNNPFSKSQLVDTTTPVKSLKEKIAEENKKVPRVTQSGQIIIPEISNARPKKINKK